MRFQRHRHPIIVGPLAFTSIQPWTEQELLERRTDMSDPDKEAERKAKAARAKKLVSRLAPSFRSAIRELTV